MNMNIYRPKNAACNCCCPCFFPPPCPPSPPPEGTFTAIKRDRATGAPLEGAIYGLYREGRLAASATSGPDGRLTFAGLSQGFYDLKEIQSPAGYQGEPGGHIVAMHADGRIQIDGVPADGFPLYNDRLSSLTFYKRDAGSGAPLSGAVFLLSNGQRAVSGPDGLVDFGMLAPGSYSMTEQAAPTGYLPNPRVYPVVVSATGSVMVDGLPLLDFSAVNVPAPTFAFRKYASDTGNVLEGAVFQLSSGVIAVSDSGGLVSFGRLAPGTYQLREISAPEGYTPSSAVYTVAVDSDGNVTVDGQDAFLFSVSNTPAPVPISEPPTINRILENTLFLSGTGVPGSLITLNLPDGSILSTVVESSGSWLALVPSTSRLYRGEVVSASQTEIGKLQSVAVERTVESLS